MRHRRTGSILLATVLLISCLAGCGKKDTEVQKTEEGTKTQVSTETVKQTENEEKKPITTDPITISILTSRHSNATNNAEDIWFFKYLEWWLGQQGYNATIEVQQSSEADQQVSLALGTNTLPDLMWGVPISVGNAMQYGVEEGMVLDWMPYINEETMPNLYESLQRVPDALTVGTLPDGGVYGLPYITYRGYMAATGSFGENHRIYFDQKWLDESGTKVPETIDEFLDVLRAFKEIKPENGEEAIPLVSNANFLERYLWIGLGYYGNILAQYGEQLALKDGQVVLPAATEDYRTFIELMNTMYTEGLISQDYFTMDTTTARALMKNGVCGAMADYGLNHTEDFSRMVSSLPVSINGNDVIVSAMADYNNNTVWASANTEYPEVLALIMDFLYSDEGACLYFYGPKQGEDPLGILDGWYLDADGNVTVKLVEDGTYANITDYSTALVQSNMYVGDRSSIIEYARKISGFEKEVPQHTLKDVITGRDIVSKELSTYSDDNPEGHWRIINMDAWENNVTAIRLPTAFLSAEDVLRAAELESVLTNHIKTESAKFITGIRPLSELDDYYKELEDLNVDEYLEIYREGYKGYIEATFK